MTSPEFLGTARQSESCESRVFAGLDASGLTVRERIEGGYDSQVHLRVSGIGRSTERVRAPDSLSWPEDILRVMFQNLGEGQAIEFSYGWSCDARGADFFDWRVTGSCFETTRDAAYASGMSFYRDLQAAFGSASAGFDLRPITPETQATNVSLPWQRSVAPTGVIAPTGLASRSTREKTVSLTRDVTVAWPRFYRPAPFDALLRAGNVIGTPWRLVVRVEPMRLSECVRDAVETAYRRLQFGSDSELFVHDGRHSRITQDRVSEAALMLLRQWSKDPRGIRVSCNIHGQELLPPALVSVIGSEIYGQRPVTVSYDPDTAVMTDRQDGGGPRLNNCFRRGECPVNLVPSAGTLDAVGAPRVYLDKPANLPPAGLRLGHCGSGNRRREVRLAAADRSQHSYVMGATGTGKTTLLANMIAHDIERGEGICVIDPHGDLYEDILHRIPAERARDVVLMDLADIEWPVGLNFLQCDGANRVVQTNFVVNEMMTIFLRLYSDPPEACGPMFETYMRNAMLTVIENDDRTATLLDVVRFFEDRAFREEAKESCSNRLSVSFWNRQAERVTGEHSLADMAPYITSKLNQFTHNGLLRPIIGQQQTTIDFRHCMDEGRIVLVNLAKGLLGQLDVQLLGMLLVGKIFNAALGRIELPEAQRRPFYLYVDEFQNMVTPTVIDLLSEARKFGLSFTLANQHLTQLSAHPKYQGVADAVLGNVATLLLFRMGPTDARRLDTYTRPYMDARDLQFLPDYHVACRMLNDNKPVRPFVFETMPPCKPAASTAQQIAIIDSIRRQCRRRYAKPRDEVERAIMQNWSKSYKAKDWDDVPR